MDLRAAIAAEAPLTLAPGGRGAGADRARPAAARGLRGPGAAALGPRGEAWRHRAERAGHRRQRLSRRGQGASWSTMARSPSRSAAATASRSSSIAPVTRAVLVEAASARRDRARRRRLRLDRRSPVARRMAGRGAALDDPALAPQPARHRGGGRHRLHARPSPVAAKLLAARHALPPRHLETLLQALVRGRHPQGRARPARRLRAGARAAPHHRRRHRPRRDAGRRRRRARPAAAIAPDRRCRRARGRRRLRRHSSPRSTPSPSRSCAAGRSTRRCSARPEPTAISRYDDVNFVFNRQPMWIALASIEIDVVPGRIPWPKQRTSSRPPR